MTQIAVIAHAAKLDPSARKGLEEAFFLAGIEAAWTDVPKAKKARKAAAKAVEAGADVVIACGGDGTVRAASEALVGTDAALAVLPAGTANLFANAFELPTKPADLVALVTSGSRRTIDSGVCNDLSFNVMAGAGFDARMIDDADEHKERLGMLAYVRAGLRSVRADRFAAKVTVDGEPFFAGLVGVRARRQRRHAEGGRRRVPCRLADRRAASTSASSPPPGCASGPASWSRRCASARTTSAARHRRPGHAQIDVRVRRQAPLPARRRHEGDDEAPDVQRATGRADTVRSRVLNASTTRANHPHPSASPAMMSVSQWTPSRARLAATATAMSTAPAAERGATDAAARRGRGRTPRPPSTTPRRGVAGRERRAVDLDELTDVGPGAVDDHLDQVHEHELTDPDGGQEERDLELAVAAVGDDRRSPSVRR